MLSQTIALSSRNFDRLNQQEPKGKNGCEHMILIVPCHKDQCLHQPLGAMSNCIHGCSYNERFPTSA